MKKFNKAWLVISAAFCLLSCCWGGYETTGLGGDRAARVRRRAEPGVKRQIKFYVIFPEKKKGPSAKAG